MGEPGIQLVGRVLPELRKKKKIDIAIAQAENVSAGKGLNLADYQRLRKAGVDGFTGGNWTMANPEIVQLLNDPAIPVTGPANMPDCAGPGYKIINNKVLIVSLLGQIVGRDSAKAVENPLLKIDEILARENSDNRYKIVINLHGDFSSEKVVIGHYLDGRASVVVGDHWHVPTADARVLPGGTAHMTDVGMCGTLNSSLGVTYESIIPRWKSGTPTKNVLATEPPYQFNALLVSVNDDGNAESVEAIQKILEA
jgi:metallophosphoesterase (TIGR00282 family)